MFFNVFVLVLTKLSFCQGEWTLWYHSVKFRYFPDYFLISYDPQSWVVLQLLNTTFINNNGENLTKHQKVLKYYENDSLQSFILLFMFLLTAKFVEIVIFRLELSLSCKKTAQSKFEFLLIQNFDLSKKTEKAVTK